MALSRRAWAALTGVAVLGCVTPAAAASIGGISPSVLQTSTNAASLFAVADYFAGSGSLSTHIADTGQAWTVTTGGFNVTNGTVAATAAPAPSQAHVIGPGGSYSAAVQFFHPWHRGQGAGLWLNGDATGNTGVWVLWDNSAGGTITVTKYVNGVATVLDARSGVGRPDKTTPTGLAVSFDAVLGQYTVMFDAFAPYTVTLSAADAAVFAANTRVGLRMEAVTAMGSFQVVTQ